MRKKYNSLTCMAIIIFIVSIISIAAADVEINVTNFPDNNFRTYISNNCDVDGDGILNNDELDKVYMDCRDRSISDLTGIQYFSALTDLDCSANNLTNIDISQNECLVIFHCSNNPLTSLDVSNNKALEKLYITNTKIENLDISKNIALKELECLFIPLKNLNINNPALISLKCRQCQLTSLNVSNSPLLSNLECASNQLTSLDVSKNTKLTYLDCSGNFLKKVDVSNNHYLTYLNLCCSQSVDELILGDISSLEVLDFRSQKITEIDVSMNKNLNKLDCSNNPLNTLDVSNNKALNFLDCSGDHLTTLNLGKNEELQYLYCNYNELSVLDVSKCPQIVHILKTTQAYDYEDPEAYWIYGYNPDIYNGYAVSFDKTVKVILGDAVITPAITPEPTPDLTPEPTPEPANTPEPDETPPGMIGTEPSPSDPVDTTPMPDNETLTIGNLKFKLSGKNAMVTGPEDKNAKKLKIPASIKVDGRSYKVTAIKAKAFKGMKKLTTVEIGKNVKDIGKEAFRNCTKLKTITIKTAKLTEKTVKSNAFKGIYKKATFKCPKKKLEAYKKLLIKRGAPKTCKFK